VVHEGGWTIAVTDGALVFHSPLGGPLGSEPARERVDDILAWLREWAEQGNLHLGPEVNMPRGDGTKLDYDLAVSALLEAG
jgi:hypothetical protein